MTLFSKITGLAITSVALAAPIAHASSTAPLTATQTARLGAQTEAQSFKGIDRYLRQQHAEQMAQAGAETEAASFKAIQKYLEQRHAEHTAQAGAETEAASFKGIQKYLEQRFGYSLGEYPRTVSEHDAPAWLQALEAQSDALNRQYGLGKYARAVDAKASAWHKTPADPVHAFC